MSGQADLSRDFVVGGQLTANLGASQYVLTVLVELELGNDNVGWVQAQGNGLAGGLVAGDSLNMDDVFEAVHGGDLALAPLVGATDDGDLVVLADGDATNVVLLAQLLAEGGTHDNTALAGGGLEVSGAALASGRRNVLADLGHCDGGS